MKIRFPFIRAVIVLSVVLVYSLFFGIVQNCNDFQGSKMVAVGNDTSRGNDYDKLPLSANETKLWKAQLTDYDFLSEDKINTALGGTTTQQTTNQQSKPATTTTAPTTTAPPPTTTTMFVPPLTQPYVFKMYTKALATNPTVGASNPPAPKANTAELTMKVKVNGQIVSKPVYEIVCSLVQQELNNAHIEAMKAQAVAAYTTLKYKEQSGTIPTVNMKSMSQINSYVKNAVSAVLGVAMYYNGKYINATYCASTGGATGSSKDVWGGDYAYLRSVPSQYDSKNAAYFKYTRTISQQTLKSTLEGKYGIKLPSDPTKWFEFLPANQGGVLDGNFVGKFKVHTSSGGYITTSGRVLREQILGSGIIRSSKFTVSYYNGNFTFVSYGSGHGVGLSQIGADCYAKYGGYKYDQILKHYYRGITLK